MKLPKQAAPVERIVLTSAVSKGSSVEASSVEGSGIWEDILEQMNPPNIGIVPPIGPFPPIPSPIGII